MNMSVLYVVYAHKPHRVYVTQGRENTGARCTPPSESRIVLVWRVPSSALAIVSILVISLDIFSLPSLNDTVGTIMARRPIEQRTQSHTKLTPVGASGPKRLARSRPDA